MTRQLPSSFKMAVMTVCVAVVILGSVDFLDQVLADYVHYQW